MDEISSQLKSQAVCHDMAPFVIELEGRGAVCLKGDSVYELTKYDGSKVQVTGLVSQGEISFFPTSSDLAQNDNIYVEQPLFINVPIENHQNEFILDEGAVEVPLDDVVSKKGFQEIDNYEISENMASEISQFSEFENKVSILELVDTPELKERSLQQSVIKKHSSCDIVCEVAPNDLLSTFVIDSNENLSDSKNYRRSITNSELVADVEESAIENIAEPKISLEVISNLKKLNSKLLAEASAVTRRGRPKKEKDIEPPLRKGPFVCEVCHAKVTTWSQLKSHKLLHAEENKPFACKVCCLSFNVEKNLNLHMLLHNVGNLTCPECNKTFTRFASFKAHLPIHEEEENVFCSECGDEFTDNFQLESHLQEHRNEWEKNLPSEDAEPKNVLSCKICNRMFTNPITFECHKKDHQRLKSQLLALAPKRKRKRFCGSAGGNYSNECSVCKKSFPKPSQLVRHIRIHTGEKPFKCSTCQAAFSQKGSLQIHMSKHNGYKPHVCSCCSLSFSQRGNLITHVNKVHRIPKEGEEIYKCVKCPCSFKKLASLNCHVTRFHIGIKNSAKPAAETSGTDVDILLNQIAELRNNLPSSSDMDILQTAIRISGLPVSIKSADEVGERFVKGNFPMENLFAVENTVEKVSENTSEVRIVTIADRSDDGNVKHFTVRQRREGNVRWHQCNVCQKEFKKPSDLIRHIRIHTREKPFKCNQCFRTFSIKSTLKSHARTHQAAKFHECKTCGKSVSSSRSLKVHQRSHVGIKPFACDVCAKSFATSGQLKTHCATNSHRTKANNPADDMESVESNYFFEEPFLVVGGQFRQQLSRKEKLMTRSRNASSAERPHECEYCRLKFRKSSHLKQHRLQHTGEKPFSCVVCHKNFTTNGVLKMHLKTHLGQKDFGCDRCTSKFSTKGSLKRHVQTFHSEDRPYMCPYCQKRFKTSVNCRKHIKIHRYDSNQHCLRLKPNGVAAAVEEEEEGEGDGEGERNGISTEENEANVDSTSMDDGSKIVKTEESTEEMSHTLLADSTGTITLSALNQESLTQESIRDLEQTLNQQLFGAEQGPEYTVQMISSGENEKENDFIESLLLMKPVILNVDDAPREPSIVHAVFSQTEELQTVSNMSEILPETKDAESDYADINGGNVKETEEIGFCRKDGYSCEICDKFFSSPQLLKAHAKTHGGRKDEFRCELCDWSTPTKSSLRRHASIHGELKKYSCGHCPAKFGTEAHVKKHRKVHEVEGEEVVGRIGKRSKGPFREFSYAETELLAAQDVRHGASVSEKILIESAAEKLRMEEKKEAEQEQVEKDGRSNFGNDCKYCRKSFKKPSDLIRHVRVHTGERPFQCTQCNKCFRVKSTLSSHLRTHFGVKPVSCHICQSMFAAKSSLKVHMRLHTGAKPFECPICGQRFRTSGHRKNHLLSHAKNKPKAWKKQHLQMLNKITVALVVNLSEETDSKKEEENAKAGDSNDVEEAFGNTDVNAVRNDGEDEALLLQLNDQTNNIVQMLSAEENENDAVSAADDDSGQQQPMQFQIYTLDGQVYITHPNSDLIICSDESVESNQGKKEVADDGKTVSVLDGNSDVIEKDPIKTGNVCKFCEKIFTKKSLLERHLRVHTGERPFSCDLCGKRFTQSNALKAHLKAHKDDRAFSCPYCDFSCVQKGNLRIHMSRTHQFAYFTEDDSRKNCKLKNGRSNSGLSLSDGLMKGSSFKSPTKSDIDQVMGELFPLVT